MSRSNPNHQNSSLDQARSIARLLELNVGTLLPTILLLSLSFGLLLAFPRAMSVAIDTAIDAKLTPVQRYQGLAIAGAVGALLIATGHTLEAWAYRHVRKICVRLTVAVRRKLLAVGLATAVRPDRGRTASEISVLTTDVEETVALVDHVCLVIPEGLKLIAIIGLITAANPTFGIVAAVYCAIMFGALVLYGKGFRALWVRAGETRSELYARIEELLAGRNVVALFDAAEREVANAAREDEKYATALHRAQLRSQYSGVIAGVFAIVSNLIVVIGGGFLVAGGKITIGGLLAMQVYLFLLIAPIYRFSLFLGQWHRSASAFRRIEESRTYSSEALRSIVTGRGKSPAPFEKLQFENVSFVPEGGGFGLRNLSFTIELGKRVACVGANGSGKSTILDLALGFCSPTEGRILLNGIDLAAYERRELYRASAVVLQNTLLFSGSIDENLNYGRAIRLADAERNEIAAIAGLDYVKRLPAGWNTQLGLGGTGLSGGEKQRLSIARALAKRSQFILLDEPGNNLDGESEHRLFRHLARENTANAIFAVVHRLNMVTEFNQILVIDNGRLMEHGSHQELLCSRGIYYRMYSLQETRQSPTVRGAPEHISTRDKIEHA